MVDAGTLGEFRAHGVAWQLSGACRLAGFLGVLSSELSVFTLAVITLERNYAITHAMHLNKRLSLRRAAGVMAAGWALAAAAAALPLLGVSDYRKFAVCLPFETGGPAALGYVAALLAANGAAFLVLLGCYLKMYCAIRGSQAWNSNDSRIAKRMALLVFTDLLCWAPVALCAAAAAAGAPLVTLEQAKVSPRPRPLPDPLSGTLENVVNEFLLDARRMTVRGDRLKFSNGRLEDRTRCVRRRCSLS